MRIALAQSIRRNILFLLFLSILVLMLNSFLPVITIQDINESIYFNLENMHHIQNVDIQRLYDALNLINIIIWAVIVFAFIAFFGVIISVSQEYKKISYLFLMLGCSSIIFSSLLCYLYLSFIFEVIGSQYISLTYIAGQFRYSYIILIIFIICIVVSILYNITILPYIYKSIKGKKEKKATKEEKQKKPFQKIDQSKTSLNNIEKINMDKFKNKKEEVENWLSTESDNLESTENTKKQDFIQDSNIDEPQEEIKDEEITIDDIEMDSSEEKTSPFSQDYIDDKPKAKKDESSDIKLSESFEKALISAIDKKKSVGEEKKTDKDKKEETKKDFTKEAQESKTEKQSDKDQLQKEKNVKKYNVKCPECTFVFTTVKNQDGFTKIKCPRCGKEGIIK